MDDVTHSSIALGEVDDRQKNPERRRWRRRKTWKNGRTFWSNGDSSECIVRNLSESGAQLELRGPLPNRFDLLIEGDACRRSCSIVWRRENRAGVMFDAPLPAGRYAQEPSGTIPDFGHYVGACSELAERALPQDRALLLEMAQAWMDVVRCLQRSDRQVL